MIRPLKPVARRLALPLLVLFGSAAYFALGVRSEPYFTDEGAYLAQTYFYRLVREARINDIDWFHPASYDHLNVGRLMVGASLDLAGKPIPESLRDMEEWYEGAEVKPPEFDRLLAGRIPMLIGSAVGCLGMFLLLRNLIGPMTGIIGAVLLATSPVYLIHARRAMADNWVVAFVLLGLSMIVGIGPSLQGGDRKQFLKGMLKGALAGLFLGLAAATKLNGATALVAVVLATGFMLAVAAPWRSMGPAHPLARRFGFVVIGTIAIAAGSFLVVHPFFYAQPTIPESDPASTTIIINGEPRSREWVEDKVRPLADMGAPERLQVMLEYRRGVLQQVLLENRFPEDSLRSIPDRLWAIWYEGMGRWSFAGAWQVPQSVAAVIGLSAVVGGLWWCLSQGSRQWWMGQLPMTWLLIGWLGVEILILSRELTLDWDRYYLGIVAQTAAFGAICVGGLLQTISNRLVLMPPQPDAEPEDADAATA